MVHCNLPSQRGFWTARPVFVVFLAKVFLVSLFTISKPSSSLLLLQSFPNSSLWRDRYLGNDQHGYQQHQKQDYYDMLGVRRNADKDEIKSAFRQLVKKYHPDANPNTDTTDQFQKINQAYQTLSDPRGRRRYNSQTYHHGFSDDTPNFIIDALENDYEPQRYHQKTVSTTDAVRYQTHELKPNNNLLEKDEDGNGTTNGGYRIRSY